LVFLERKHSYPHPSAIGTKGKHLQNRRNKRNLGNFEGLNLVIKHFFVDYRTSNLTPKMKAPTPLLTGCFFVVVFLIACHKDSTTPTTPPVTDTTIGTMNINLTFASSTMTGSFELIISEPGGKVLIDSLAQTQTAIRAALKTNATLVDVTYIFVLDTSQSSPLYSVWVYKGVNPSKWVTVTAGGIGINYPAPQTAHDNLFCTNYPSSAITDGNVYNSFVFNNGINNSFTSGLYSPVANTLSLGYQSHSGAYNYFVLPHLGLYKLFVPSGNDTLDLSMMDTVSSLTFNRQFPFSLIYQGCYFNGIPDTTDLSQSVSFMNIFNPIVPPNADLQFPKMPMQKYEISISAKNSINDYPSYYGYVNSPPMQLPFPDASSFSVVSQQNDNFTVTFTNPALISYCMTYIAGTYAFVNFWSSPDSTTIHPISFLTNQKSKLLKGVSLTDLTPKSFVFTDVPGFAYVDYLSYICNPSLLQTHQITTYTSYTRNF